MNIMELQDRLQRLGFYTERNGKPLIVDGKYGPGTRDAILASLAAGPKLKASKQDFIEAGRMIGVTGAEIRAVWLVESSGDPFNDDGRPMILFEPHRFWKTTKGRFKESSWNYPKWDRKKYPKTQADRYKQMLSAIGQDVDAGFMSASWGGPQILGENFKAAGYPDPFAFALGMAQTEGAQIRAMINFIKANHLDDELRAHNWAKFAAGYNGTAYRENKYDINLAKEFANATKAGY